MDSWLDPALRDELKRIESIQKSFESQLLTTTGRIEIMALYAKGVAALKSALTDGIVKLVMNLQNHDFGFRTDQPGGYKQEVVHDVLIDALLNGVWPSNNEFNIIAGRLFIAHAGWVRKVAEIPGMDEPPSQFTFGKPDAGAGFGGVKFNDVTTTYRFQGQDRTFKCNVTIKTNNGTTLDNIETRVQRKVLKALYRHLTAKDLPILKDDDEADERAARAQAIAESAPAQHNPATETLAEINTLWRQLSQAKKMTNKEYAAELAKFGVRETKHLTAAQLTQLAETLRTRLNPPTADDGDPLAVLTGLVAKAIECGAATKESWAAHLEDRGVKDVRKADAGTLGELITAIETMIRENKASGDGLPFGEPDGMTPEAIEERR